MDGEPHGIENKIYPFWTSQFCRTISVVAVVRFKFPEPLDEVEAVNEDGRWHDCSWTRKEESPKVRHVLDEVGGVLLGAGWVNYTHNFLLPKPPSLVGDG